MASLTLALFQNNSVPCNPAAQLDALETGLEDAARAGADLLITPELFLCGYNIGDQVPELAEPQDGESLRRAASLAKDAGVACLLAYAEQEGRKIYNSACLFSQTGEMLANFRKLHLSGPYEKAQFDAGSDIITAQINGVTVAPLICYDVEIPEAVRAAARAGADLVMVPTALREQYSHLTDTMIPTRAFENGVYVAYVNHAGSEGAFTYCGLSRLAGPRGEVSSAGAEDCVHICTLDTAEIEKARAELPYLKEARRDL